MGGLPRAIVAAEGVIDLARDEALEAALRDYIAATNAAPRPFVSTRSADEILASVKRFCQRISGSDH